MMDALAVAARAGTDLSYRQARAAMGEMLSGRVPEPEVQGFLGALAAKGETDDELTGMLDEMMEFSVPVEAAGAIDMCGTGGDGMRTFNVSTTASFIVAAAGGSVAKHGNRSSSGVSGSADIFEYLGYDLEAGPGEVAGILGRHGICFMFAQRYHPAMRHVSAARKRLGGRTAFNLLGPLANPARVGGQLVGVSSEGMLSRIPGLLGRRGAQDVMAVRSDDGMDEFSTSSTNRVAVLRDGRVETSSVDAESVGLHPSSPGEIAVGTMEEAVSSFVGVLNGTAHRAMIETAVLNAAGGLIVAGLAEGFAEAVEIAMSTVEGGGAFRKLEGFVRDTGDVSRLKEAADG